MTRQTSIQLTEATDRQVKALTEQGFGTFTDVVRIAIDRMYRTETRKQEAEMDEKMAYVVIVDDINEAMALIREADEGFPFDDNGGDPDGPSWIVEPGYLGRALGPIIERGLGHQVHGVLVDDYRGTDEERTRLDVQFSQWCGFSSRSVAYGIR